MTSLTDIASKIINRKTLDALQPYIANAVEAAVLAEREACAKACEEYGNSVNNEWNKQLGVADDLVGIAEECAATIRARGEK